MSSIFRSRVFTGGIAVSAKDGLPSAIWPAPVITTVAIPAGEVGVPYDSGPIVVTGGALPLEFTAVGLPGWAVINLNTGAIIGLPDEEDVDIVTVTVEDALARTDSQDLSLEIGGAA
jgi:hypothetical protein